MSPAPKQLWELQLGVCSLSEPESRLEPQLQEVRELHHKAWKRVVWKSVALPHVQEVAAGWQTTCHSDARRQHSCG